MEFLSEYGLFLAEVVTFVVATLILVAGLVAILSKNKGSNTGNIKITKLNDSFDDMADTIREEVLSKKEMKAHNKKEKKAHKALAKQAVDNARKRIFVLDFDGDIKASELEHLRHEITAILNVATPRDEVLLRLESGGGMVHAYGLAASQLQRITKRRIPLTIAIDKVAASGGYMMACVGNRIIAAPFAIVGSIGVVAQIPNFHKILKKNDIDFEEMTAGEYKRTLTMFGENTDKARKKFKEEIEDIHLLFKDFITENRPAIRIDEVATGEHWLAKRAYEMSLVDELITSDDYLLQASNQSDLYEVEYEIKAGLADKLTSSFSMIFDKVWDKFVSKEQYVM